MSEITHVAIVMEDGVVWALPKPARHYHIIRAYYTATGEPVSGDAVQGFLASGGYFITREVAFMLTGKGRGGRSYSEDLWDTPQAAQEMYLAEEDALATPGHLTRSTDDDG